MRAIMSATPVMMYTRAVFCHVLPTEAGAYLYLRLLNAVYAIGIYLISFHWIMMSDAPLER